MTQPTLWDVAARTVQDTSLEVYRTRILPTLTAREVAIFRALCDYLRVTEAADATGGELTAWAVSKELARDVNGVRPRLTGLLHKGWIESLPARRCRAYGNHAHPVRPVVSWAAVARMETITSCERSR